ncbi:MAG: hypothetical protein E3J87_07770 [Candidatus Cloacimonadota bacterium]|nr:MAG: hypothetical protein E3J87_07770 [Candidatus Cloacimonadota bacterium]
MSKKTKKKRVRDRLAKRRGKKRIKKKIPPKISKKKVEPEVLNNMMLATIPLADTEELRNIEFDKEKLNKYLESARKEPEQKPIDFIKKGIRNVITPDFLKKTKERLAATVEKKEASEQMLYSISAFYRLLAMGILPEHIPMFLILFAKQVKKHPLSDDPKLWRYIMDFLPKKVVSPEEEKTLVVPEIAKSEKKEEKRDERYPHIILPK